MRRNVVKVIVRTHDLELIKDYFKTIIMMHVVQNANFEKWSTINSFFTFYAALEEF